jgi:hypothetical protein
MEHRWGHRVAVRLDVRLVCGRFAIGEGRLRDVSVSGAFIETELELPILAQVRIGASDFEVAAHVVRAEATGIGVEWCALAPWCVSDLQKLAMRGESVRIAVASAGS